MTTQSPKRDAALLEAVTVPSQAVLLADLRERISRGQGFAVATMNLDHAVKLRRDPAFRRAYAAQTHVTADGRPIVWLSRLAGHPVDLVTGSDLVEPLVALCAELGVPVAILGSTQEVLSEAAARLRDSHPGLEIAALLSPPMGFDPEGEAADGFIKDLDRSGARVCLLALGAPKQETFAVRALQALPGVGFVSVGAGIDFVAGTQIRAPRLVRAMALEWLWRLSGDPRRLFRRYALCAVTLPALARGALSMRSANGDRRAQ
jgi:exopolysaccharide biosynthesis WecB/TagA/CpsF family protein